MAKKKNWVYLGGTPNRYLEEGEVYSFNPKANPDGTVSCKIQGDDMTHKMNLGYRTLKEFEHSWKEA